MNRFGPASQLDLSRTTTPNPANLAPLEGSSVCNFILILCLFVVLLCLLEFVFGLLCRSTCFVMFPLAVGLAAALVAALVAASFLSWLC